MCMSYVYVVYVYHVSNIIHVYNTFIRKKWVKEPVLATTSAWSWTDFRVTGAL